jgi:hypothetical protein
MSWTPKVVFEQRTQRVPGAPVRLGESMFGSCFAIELNPSKFPDMRVQNQRYRDALDRDPTGGVITIIREVELLMIEEAVEGEAWYDWLVDQSANNHGGEWMIPNAMGLSLGPLLADGANVVRVVIENDATALLFKQAFGSK